MAYIDTKGVAEKYTKALDEISEEIMHARSYHGPMRGAHEGYAVILEELDELWEEVRAKKFSKGKARAEARQVAAMALAFMAEVCGDDK